MTDKFLYTSYDDSGSLSITGVNDELKQERQIIIPPKILCKGRYYAVTKIGLEAFCQCKKLEDIIIPSSVTSIAMRAFKNCRNLERVVIPDSVTHIGDEAFKGCKKLKTLTLPASVEYIGNEAFKNCEKLENIDYFASVKRVCFGTFSYCFSLRKVVLPQGMTELSPYAFKDCRNLTSIELPPSTVIIENGALEGCASLNKIICNSISPPRFEFVDNNPFGFDMDSIWSSWYTGYYLDPFEGIDKKSCFLYVPEISIEEYKKSQFWGSFTIKGL